MVPDAKSDFPRASSVDGILHFGVKFLQPGIKGAHMERKLVVDHPGNDSAGLDRTALLDVKRHDRAADPGPGLDQVTAFNPAKHGLEIGLRLCPDDKFACPHWRRPRCQEKDGGYHAKHRQNRNARHGNASP